MPQYMKNIQASLRSLIDNGIVNIAGAGAPSSLTGVGVTGKGSLYFDSTNGVLYINVGTAVAPVWTEIAGSAIFNQLSGTIAAADITATGAGKFGHANGVELVPAQGAGTIVELISAFLVYDFLTAAYTNGGNTTINWSGGGAAITGLVSAANFAGAAGDKLVTLYPLAAAGLNTLTNTGLSLVSSAAFTQPGTAAGVIRWVVNYRVHQTGL